MFIRIISPFSNPTAIISQTGLCSTAVTTLSPIESLKSKIFSFEMMFQSWRPPSSPPEKRSLLTYVFGWIKLSKCYSNYILRVRVAFWRLKTMNSPSSASENKKSPATINLRIDLVCPTNSWTKCIFFQHLILLLSWAV